MIPPGRPKGEYRNAQDEGCLMNAPGRRTSSAPKGQGIRERPFVSLSLIAFH